MKKENSHVLMGVFAVVKGENGEEREVDINNIVGAREKERKDNELNDQIKSNMDDGRQ